MGQKLSQEHNEKNKADILIINEVFSQGVVHASQKLKEYLGFEDPQSKFRPAMDTLNEIFLVNFIGFCIEKGVEERIMTSKMTKQQSLLLGIDWIWTLSGADKQINLQIAVQSLQMTELLHDETGPSKEAALAGQPFKNKSRFEKLEEFCTLVGQDCLGLFIMFGVPGKPKDIRGVMLDSINKEKRKNHLSSENALRQFVLNTDSFLSTKEMLENCLCKKNGLKEVGKVYINFL
ncbi:rab15 effector protein [Gopherus flavomarginatus]|uniref:RAB15 effector protein n=1 Tax=Gopherus evgoodei TaxID=1825980 RepID=A0A8C4VPB4_9SAUR|nr:rab15 effector protein [Gopherus evgoodei]XP_050775959.1 rab15 effector protein [Gopherus flavomarginatus]